MIGPEPGDGTDWDKTMPGVFLSYRRSDSCDVAGRMYDVLKREFGEKNVFKDVDNIPLFVQFPEFVEKTIRECKAVLVVIGTEWGTPRLEDPEDYVRREVEVALSHGVPVLPVMVGGAEIPKKSELPESIWPLTKQNGQSVRPDPDFHKDMARLTRELVKFGLRRRKAHPKVRRLLAWAGAGLVVAAALAVFLLYWKMLPPSQLAVGYGLAYPTVNASRGQLDPAWESGRAECLEGVTKCVHLTGHLEEGGFAVVNLWKPCYLLGVFPARLPRESLYYRLAASESASPGALNVELTVKDAEKDEVHFGCAVPTDGVPRDFVIPADALRDAHVDLNELELLAFGPSSSAGALPGRFRMSVFGISTEPLPDATECELLW